MLYTFSFNDLCCAFWRDLFWRKCSSFHTECSYLKCFNNSYTKIIQRLRTKQVLAKLFTGCQYCKAKQCLYLQWSNVHRFLLLYLHPWRYGHNTDLIHQDLSTHWQTIIPRQNAILWHFYCCTYGLRHIYTQSTVFVKSTLKVNFTDYYLASETINQCLSSLKGTKTFSISTILLLAFQITKSWYV